MTTKPDVVTITIAPDADPADVDKTFNFINRELNDALSPYIGTKADPETVKASIKSFFDKLNENTPAWDELGKVMADGIRAKLKEKSPLEGIFPVLKGAFFLWCEDGVVHVAGTLGTEYKVRVCDWERLKDSGYCCEGDAITCLTCLTARQATNL